MTAATAPNPAAQDVGRIPQTTVGLPPGGSFVRYSQGDSQQPGYTVSTNFGLPVTQPLSAVGGFFSGFIIKVQTVGSTSTGATVFTADAPYSVIQNLSLRDSSGQPIYGAVDGFGLFLINLYSGMCGQAGIQDPRVLPSFAAPQTTSGAGSGGFTFKLWVPLAINSALYCALPADNSAEVPKLYINMAASTAVYTTPPTTLPTSITLTVEEIYAAIPNNYPDLVPFDVGASAQWLVTVSGQNPPNGAGQRVLDQGVGQFVHTKIYVLRDSTNARIDSFPGSDLTLWIDNYPYKIELSDDRFDRMAKAFGVGATAAGLQARPTGVIAFTWRQSMQTQVSDADDLEDVLVTTGSTKVELGGTWGTISNQPAQLTCYTGMIFPGASGWPYGSQSMAA